jgi:hypothetical protein
MGGRQFKHVLHMAYRRHEEDARKKAAARQHPAQPGLKHKKTFFNLPLRAGRRLRKLSLLQAGAWF